MASQVELIPLKGPITWSDLRGRIKNIREMHGTDHAFKDEIKCLHYLDKKNVDDLGTMSSRNGYVFQENATTKIILYCSDLDRSFPAHEYLEEFIEDYTEKEISNLAEVWEKQGYSYVIEFSGNPFAARTTLIISQALATATESYVMLNSRHDFSCGYGLFRYKTYLNAKMTI